MVSLPQLGAWFWRGEGPLVLGDLAVQPGDVQSFQRAWRDATVHKARLLIGLLLALNLGFWLTDAWLLADVPTAQPALTEGRLAATACGLVALAVSRVPDRLRELVAWLTGAATCGVVAWTVGRIGGPDSAWFFYTFPFLFLGLLGWVTPARRVLGSALLCAATAACFFGPHPAHRADPLAGTALANLVCVTLLAIAIGFYVDHMRLRLYLMGREREHLVADLGARVRAQTQHIQRLLDHVETAREAERCELAAELHDELGQLLTAMRCVVKAQRVRDERRPDLDQIAQLPAAVHPGPARRAGAAAPPRPRRSGPSGRPRRGWSSGSPAWAADFELALPAGGAGGPRSARPPSPSASCRSLSPTCCATRGPPASRCARRGGAGPAAAPGRGRRCRLRIPRRARAASACWA
ncbi:MAG: hypothetical protein R3F60_20850 [bacterium]